MLPTEDFNNYVPRKHNCIKGTIILLILNGLKRHELRNSASFELKLTKMCSTSASFVRHLRFLLPNAPQNIAGYKWLRGADLERVKQFWDLGRPTHMSKASSNRQKSCSADSQPTQSLACP